MNRMKTYLAGSVIAVALVSGVALTVANPTSSPTVADTTTVSADGTGAANIIW